MPKIPLHRPGPAGGARDRNRRQNLELLTTTGLALFLAEGTAAVSVDDIVGKAKMAKGSFYRHVSDKAELVAQIIAPVATEIAHALDRCEQALRVARADALVAIYLTLALELSQVVARHPSHVLLYLQEARAPRGGARGAIHALADHLTARAIALTETALEHRLIRDVDPRIAALTVIGAIDSILFAHLRAGRGATTDVPAITGELVAIIVNGIRRNEKTPQRT
jgi:AcrR family transcriptional regulator